MVVFPAPLGPSTATHSPCSTAKDTPRTAWTSPYDFVSSATSMIGTNSDYFDVGRELHFVEAVTGGDHHAPCRRVRERGTVGHYVTGARLGDIDLDRVHTARRVLYRHLDRVGLREAAVGAGQVDVQLVVADPRRGHGDGRQVAATRESRRERLRRRRLGRIGRH